MTGPFEIDRIENAVSSFLNAVVSAAANLGVELPARQVVSAGMVPSDCEQVAVWFVQLSTGTPEPAGRGTGSGTYPVPTTASGESNMTLYNAVIQLAIVRRTHSQMTGLSGTVPPAPSAYLQNLADTSADVAVLLAAADQISMEQMSATPRPVTAGNPQGGLRTTSLRLTCLV